jgi:metal-responsive CopG/Arc/MetJ family transcriptional regulator
MKVKNRTAILVYVPDDMLEKVNRQCERLGQNRSVYVLRALTYAVAKHDAAQSTDPMWSDLAMSGDRAA